MTQFDDKLPEQVSKLIPASDSDIAEIINKSGYIPPTKDLFIDAIVVLAMGKNVLLTGPTGSGKTKFAETLANLFKQSMYSINGSIDIDAEALMGFKTLAYHDDKQMIEFVPGPVTNAMTKGSFLYIDEINMAKPETLPILNGVLDYRRTVTNPFTNEVITAQDEFNVIAAINEGYIGTVPLNEALKNRFIVIEVPYIQGKQLKKLIKTETNLQENETVDLFVQLSADLITAVQQGKLSEEAASIRALLDACDLSTIIPVRRAILRAITAKVTEERERDLISNIVETLVK